MTTTQEDALRALASVVRPVVVDTGAAFEREPERAPDASHAGVVIMVSGDPGEAEVILSPLTYCWEHRVPFVISACGVDRNRTVGSIVARIDSALAADRTLGGAVDDTRIDDGVKFEEFEGDEGIETERNATLVVTLYYDTASGAG